MSVLLLAEIITGAWASTHSPLSRCILIFCHCAIIISIWMQNYKSVTSKPNYFSTFCIKYHIDVWNHLSSSISHIKISCQLSPSFHRDPFRMNFYFAAKFFSLTFYASQFPQPCCLVFYMQTDFSPTFHLHQKQAPIVLFKKNLLITHETHGNAQVNSLFFYLCCAIPRNANPEGIPKPSRRHLERIRWNWNNKQEELWQE